MHQPTRNCRQVSRPSADAGPGCSHVLTRSAFLARAGLALLGAVAASAGRAVAAAAEPSNGAGTAGPASRPTSRPFAGKGRPDSPVKRWDVVTIGNLSRNRYWGEPDAKGVRAVVCTCTL